MLKISKNACILLGILTLSLLLRCIPPILRLVPFSFDHGKDSLAIWHMIQTHSPALIGPWTSIPGLFFGPAWYYLLAPGYILTHGDPISAVWTMILLCLFQIIFVYRYFGLRTALLFAVMPMYLITSTSAWNPFPMTFVTLIVITLSKNSFLNNNHSKAKCLLIGFIAGLGFHFSSAYSLFFLPYLGYRSLRSGLKLAPKRLLLISLGLFLAFLPQLIFEFRHDFIQTKSIAAYFQNTSPTSNPLEEAITVITQSWGEIKLGLFVSLKGFNTFQQPLNLILFTFLFTCYLVSWYRWFNFRQRSIMHWVKEMLVFLVFIPLVGFTFLHFNLWYTLPITTLATLIVGNFIQYMPKKLYAMFALTLIIVSLSNLWHYTQTEVPIHKKSFGMLSTKEMVLEFIASQTQAQPYSLYVYVPEIYDFAYQYLIIRNAYRGSRLPTEFSYKPNAPEYIPPKSELLQPIGSPVSTPHSTFYIVEPPSTDSLLQEWWDAQEFKQVALLKNFGELQVYSAKKSP